ncbi:MAG: sigma-70 family RNA polymerase sigma factor, partial [Planctomycetota bacterium]
MKAQPMDSMPRTAADLARHASAVRRVARALLADEAAAEDVSQEALRLALERPAIARESLGGWLVGAARRLAGTRARTDARRRRREHSVAAAEAQPSAAERAAGLEVAERMVALVRALPESQAEVIWLRYWEDLPPRAIARRSGLGVEAVKTRLKRGLATLRRELDADTPGGRAAWLGALAPLWACPPGAVLSVPSLSTATGLPLVFVLKKLSLIALVAAVLGAGFLVLNDGQDALLPRPSSPSTETRVAVAGASDDHRTELADPAPRSERSPRGATAASLARVLEARVVRAFDGAPLAGIVVAALEQGRPEIESVGRSARSDEQGRVRFEDLRAGPVRLVADRGAWVDVNVAESGRTQVELAVELGVRVRGLVLEPGGQPVAGAAIVLQTGEPSLDWNQIAQVAVTGADGRFELIDVEVRSLIAARAAGYAPSDLDLLAHRALDPGDECEVTLHLVAGGGVARGVVLSPQGAPVSGAHVWVEDRGEPTAWRNTPRGSHLSTAQDGTFELGSLALGRAHVVVAARGYAREVVRIPVVSGSGPQSPIHLRPPAGIDGRVLAADGRPQGGVTVRLARIGQRYAADYAPLGFRPTVSDVEGRFHFDDLPPGEARVIAQPRGHPALEQQGTLRVGERSNMELRTPSGLVLTGRALEPGGEPLTGVIILLDGGAGWRTQLQTEADGSFRFESVPEGPLTVYLYPARDGWSRPAVTREGVTAQDSPLLLVWDSAPEVGAVRGRFADPAGWVQAGDRVLAQLLQEDRFTQEILIDMPDG